MSIKSLYPDIRPSLNLDFANSKALDGRITFTRDSTATYVGANGLIQTAQKNAPRFDHDPVTGESLGLLSEEQRTNKAYGTPSAAQGAVYLGQNNSLTGTNNAILFGKNSPTSGQSNLGWTVSGTVSTTSFVFSVFVKEVNTSTFFLQLVNNPVNDNLYVYYNVATGYTSFTDFAASGNLTVTPSIENYVDGWYRLIVRVQGFVNGAINGDVRLGFAEPSNYSQQYTNTTHEVLVYGPQLEDGAFASSLIPTESATGAVTRIADRARITGTSFSNFFNTTEGTLVVQGRTSAGNSLNYTNQPIISIHAGSATNRMIMFDRDSGTLEWNVVDGSFANGSGLLLDETTSYSGAADYIMCGTYKNGAPTRAVANGLGADGTIIESSGKNDTVNIFNQMDIGNEFGTRHCSSPIKQIRYYPLSLSDDQIKTLVQ